MLEGPAAPSDAVVKRLITDTVAFEPDRVAYQLVREIYAWYGLAENSIPFVTVTDEKLVIDTKAISNIGKN